MTLELPGWKHVYSGKVRDLYEPAGETGDAGVLADGMLMVASDRVSAFDHVLEPPIPSKGSVLTQLSLWWFDRLDVANHVLSSDAVSAGGLVPDAVAGRAMVVKKLAMHPVECVVRGYLSGSAWVEYQASQSVCGVHLPPGHS
ncbi:MAG: phosphoribosylaminoimidazolesuccinocarboxamide synthase, partial [Cryobacterium sp.]|nr:phosphoribosylaminoimidazolesuccinocarboxamide synthase [Cryobacterium sp.]